MLKMRILEKTKIRLCSAPKPRLPLVDFYSSLLL